MSKDGKSGKRSLEQRQRREEYAPTLQPERRGEIPAWSMAAKERVAYDAEVVLFDAEQRVLGRVVELAPDEVSIQVDPAPPIDSLVSFYLPMNDGGDDMLLAGWVISQRQGEAWSDGVSVRLKPLGTESADRYGRLLASRSLVPRAQRSEPSLGFEMEEDE